MAKIIKFPRRTMTYDDRAWVEFEQGMRCWLALCAFALGSFVFIVVCWLVFVGIAHAQTDPGVRGGTAGAGGPLVGLTTPEKAFWVGGFNRFKVIADVPDGLGPRFNGNSCAQCHSQPAVGGSAPAVNPQVAVASLAGATNAVPSFITLNGPAREVRFKSDGGVHDLFTIQGRTDAPGCVATPTDFSNASNLSFRIPTPTFGLGLVEGTPDETFEADAAAQATLRGQLKIGGHFNHKGGGSDSDFNTSGNTGTLTKFGWKAQNPSLLVFSGEAYLVEMGVTNEAFTTKRGVAGTSGCMFNQTPEDVTNLTDPSPTASSASDFSSDIVNFAAFMRLNEPPTPLPPTADTTAGAALFVSAGCAACHVAQHTTGSSVFTGQSARPYFPYSDFQVHGMGKGLDDGVAQGEAATDEFRTAPLWGAGQRVFFLHDGRTKDLLAAIEAHASPQSEANKVIDNFNALSVPQRQAILDFLRSL